MYIRWIIQISDLRAITRIRTLGLTVSDTTDRLCRHFLRNLKWIRPISGAKNRRYSLPSAARVRPASAPFPSFAALRTPTGATTNDLTPCRMPLVLSPPPLALRFRQNKRPYGYAGVVVHRSSAAAPSTSMYSFYAITVEIMNFANVQNLLNLLNAADARHNFDTLVPNPATNKRVKHCPFEN